MTDDLINSLLEIYGDGIFPMSDSRDDMATYWVEPQKRGIIPLEDFNIPRSLKKFIKFCDYTVTFNQAFSDVISQCAQTPRNDNGDTWINHEIENWFNQLHHAGYAHSVEVWDSEHNLIGGLYGLAQGGCFNGESMFSTKTNASKIALIALVDRLRDRQFTLLDTQFINDHLKQFGCIEIPQSDYLTLLDTALHRHVTFA